MVILLLIWALAELFLIVKVAEWVGFFWMLMLLLVSWPIGWTIMRHEGRAALANLTTAVRAGQAPTNEVIEGVLVIAGGLLLMLPGFLSDIVGGLLLFRPSRRYSGRIVIKSKRSYLLTRLAGWAMSVGSAFTGRAPQRYDAESTAFDVNERKLEK